MLFVSQTDSIERYHEERRLLRAKGAQKDRLITDMAAHYDKLMGQVRELSSRIESMEGHHEHDHDHHRHDHHDHDHDHKHSHHNDSPLPEKLKNLQMTSEQLIERAAGLTSPIAVTKEQELTIQHVLFQDEDRSRYIEYPPCPGCSSSTMNV